MDKTSSNMKINPKILALSVTICLFSCLSCAAQTTQAKGNWTSYPPLSAGEPADPAQAADDLLVPLAGDLGQRGVPPGQVGN